MESNTVEWLALETNYFDGEEPWTRFSDEIKVETVAEWLKEIIPAPEYGEVFASISYSEVA